MNRKDKRREGWEGRPGKGKRWRRWWWLLKGTRNVLTL